MYLSNAIGPLVAGCVSELSALPPDKRVEFDGSFVTLRVTPWSSTTGYFLVERDSGMVTVSFSARDRVSVVYRVAMLLATSEEVEGDLWGHYRQVSTP